MSNVIKLSFDRQTLDKYAEHYFELHPRAKKKPIQQPYHESINVWMIMKRMGMNALKQRWKDFVVWLVNDAGLQNKQIEECELEFVTYYPTNRPHDIDNSTPKFIIDGLVESGLLVSDDSKHVTKLTLQCFVDVKNPRTEITIVITD